MLMDINEFEISIIKKISDFHTFDNWEIGKEEKPIFLLVLYPKKFVDSEQSWRREVYC